MEEMSHSEAFLRRNMVREWSKISILEMIPLKKLWYG
jgi:hypothetical protein